MLSYNGLTPVGHMVRNDLDQLMLDIYLCKTSAESNIMKMVNEWPLPDSLKGLGSDYPPYHECKLYIAVMSAMYDFLKDVKKYYKARSSPEKKSIVDASIFSNPPSLEWENPPITFDIIGNTVYVKKVSKESEDMYRQIVAYVSKMDGCDVKKST